jgi:CRP/FNR family cyclic AMP-dependent transcriptional regulator
MDQKFWYLKDCSLFHNLSDEQVRRLEVCAKARDFKRGALIYVPSDLGDCVLVLAAGRVKIFHNTQDGKQALLALIDPGELFGELALVDQGQREEYAEAMERSTVLVIPTEEVQRLMDDQPRFSQGLNKLLGLRAQHDRRRLKSLLFRSNRERVIHLLFELAEKYGKYQKEGAISIGIRLSHQELASIIGSTRETVTLVLGELEREGAITITRKEIVLNEPGQLAAIIEIQVPNLRVHRDLWRQTTR